MAQVTIEYEDKQYTKNVVVTEEVIENVKYLGRVGKAFFAWDFSKYDLPLIKLDGKILKKEKDINIAALLVLKHLQELRQERLPRVTPKYSPMQKLQLQMFTDGLAVRQQAEAFEKKSKTEEFEKFKQKQINHMKFAFYQLLILVSPFILIFIYVFIKLRFY